MNESEDEFPKSRTLENKKSREKWQDPRQQNDQLLRFRERKQKTASKGQLYINTDNIPADEQYAYKAEKVYHKPDPKFYSLLEDEGFEPVPEDRHPDIPNRVGDLVLCRRPIAFKVYEDEINEKKALEAQNYADRNLERNDIHQAKLTYEYQNRKNRNNKRPGVF